jgi:hypothetical protein
MKAMFSSIWKNKVWESTTAKLLTQLFSENFKLGEWVTCRINIVNNGAMDGYQLFIDNSAHAETDSKAQTEELANNEIFIDDPKNTAELTVSEYTEYTSPPGIRYTYQ